MMLQHLPEEIDHFRRCDPFVVQAKQQVSTPTDGGHRRDSATFAGDFRFRGLAARRPRFAQESRQRHVRLVLKVTAL